jgi:hypothetical protein
MKKQRFTEEQIIAVLKEQEAGAKVADLCRKQEDRSSRQAGQEAIHHRDVAARRCRLDLFEPGLQLLQG